MIIDWTNSIKTLQSDPSQENMVLETITNDLRRVLEGACKGDLVIIRFSEGFRAEVRYLNETGVPDIKSTIKDFNKLRQYNLQIEKIGELREQVTELLKDYPEQLAGFDQYITQKLEQPLFEINYVLNNKVEKSFSRVHYLVVHMSILGILTGFYQDRETIG
ncbi:MAG TPA: hypothetical protein VHY08_07905 [Bacillota bacterium]|nr:hypothetical protein [Bacillota bacterium]